jgi:aryl-alcohol dehydrogenase-like predicted oxidoreductase
MKLQDLLNNRFDLGAPYKIGLGTAQLSNTDGSSLTVNYMNESSAMSILQHAIGRGVFFFDSGVNYGKSENLLGDLKKVYGDSIIVATKIGMSSQGVRNFSITSLRDDLSRSLERLNVKQIDLLQLNKPTISDLENEELIIFLQTLKKEKIIKYLGVVVGDVSVGEYAVANIMDLDSLQIFYNMLHPEAERLLKDSYRRGITTIVRSPINSGLLSGYYNANTKFSSNDERGIFFKGRLYEKRIIAVKNIQRKLCINDEDLIAYAINFIVSNSNVSITIPGASSLKQLDNYLSSSNKSLLIDNSQLEKIKNIVESYYGILRSEIQL